MTDLCKGECRFVVKVLEHDWLEYESLYFIDMEFCSQNLHDYIRQNSANFVRRPNFKEPPIPKNMESELEIVQPNTGAVTAQPPPSNTPVDHDIGWEPIGTIIENIVSGLNYIHGKKVVHRDLKPQNGTALLLLVFLTSI